MIRKALMIGGPVDGEVWTVPHHGVVTTHDRRFARIAYIEQCVTVFGVQLRVFVAMGTPQERIDATCAEHFLSDVAKQATAGATFGR